MRSTTYTLLALAALCALSAIAGAEKCPRVEDCKCRPQEYKPATTQYDENGCLICKCEKCPGKKKALKAAESKWNCRRFCKKKAMKKNLKETGCPYGPYSVYKAFLRRDVFPRNTCDMCKCFIRYSNGARRRRGPDGPSC